MKKLIPVVLSSLLVLLAIGAQPVSAADRVTKVVKVCKFTANDVIADAVLARSDGSGNWCDVSDMVVSRVVVETNTTAITGTNMIYKLISSSDPSNAGATTDPPVLGSDGSTAVVSATITSTGRGSKGFTVGTIGSSGVSQNVGTRLGIFADTSSLSAFTGSVWVIVFGSQ
jgi:hypothetical protein